MRVLHVTPSVSPLAGGPAVSIPALCDGLATRDCKVTLVAGSDVEYVKINVPFKTFPLKQFPKALRRSPEMRKWIFEKCKNGEFDILHSHNLWGMPTYYPYLSSRKFEIPHVLSPRGTLSDYSLSTGSKLKKAYWHSILKKVMNTAAGFHVTSSDELYDIRKMGVRGPVAIIHNGIEVEDIGAADAKKQFLYFGRLHQEKGIDVLLKAWKLISLNREKWTLRIVGPSDVEYLSYLKNYIEVNKIHGVNFGNPVFGKEKFSEYRQSSFFVLPSYTENFGLSVLEALLMRVPAIVNRGAPWSDLNKFNCGWWIDQGPDELASALLLAINTPETERIRMGVAGRELILNKYSIQSSCSMMIEFYEYLLKRRIKPNFVDL